MGDNFYDLKFSDENKRVNDLAASLESSRLNAAQVEQQARVLIETIRAKKSEIKGFQSLMQRYDLTSEEGLALMTLAEALLRIPDAATANMLIDDKISEADWTRLFGQAGDMAGKLSGMGLKLSQKVMGSAIGKMGMPFIRKATVEAMQLMGKTFVLGRDIDEALKNAVAGMQKGYIYSYDMLGEGARTSHDAQYYFDSYVTAIRAIGHATVDPDKPILERPGISVKLSALYPRYEYAQKEKCVKVLSERLLELCVMAAEYRLNLTVDAEECDRFDLSLKIIKSVIGQPTLKGWDGFGMAIQAYHKRAEAAIDKVLEWTQDHKGKFSVRLVKGAYWDTEIKHAQIEGYSGYPVYTRKENTDLSYLVCAKKLLDNRDRVIPLLGTHNAQTVASVLSLAGDNRGGFAFQRLHGMGEALYDQLLSMDIPCSVYAPVGTHKDLLAYLVRRLLENGANSSFVNKLYDDTPLEELLADPLSKVKAHDDHFHPLIPLPMDIYGTDRRNSKGIDLHSNVVAEPFLNTQRDLNEKQWDAPCILNGKHIIDGDRYGIANPADKGDKIGDCWYLNGDDLDTVFDDLQKGFEGWATTSASYRSECLMKLADLYEEHFDNLMNIAIREAGKTVPDAVAEIREAVDFCRYYAAQGKDLFAPQTLQGPTGEKNTLQLEGRGVFICISPWNFPLAIFTGQVTAALMAGNAVIAKPAEQTPAIAAYAVDLMIKAGIAADAIALVQGDGAIGEALVNHPDVAGVAFTGSTQVAKSIQRALAAKDGAIVPLIAETGGLNAMIVDSTALPEQVCDTVIHSAFGSAGQRCSALRILCVQDDIADGVVKMIKGAMDHIVVGTPSDLSTDVGPVIDDESLSRLSHYRSQMEGISKKVHKAPFDNALDKKGTFFTPMMVEIDDIDLITEEVFGPVLHVVRFDEAKLKTLVQNINDKGFGLTFGLHTRIKKRQEYLSHKVNAGNIYINRGQTGAVVGVQPFGGRGLSGTGPKAGGPYYLHAFATERSISNNITASGGNTTLINL